MENRPAPIAVFAYRRPDHTRRSLEALRANPLAERSDLFVFSDGPKNPEAAAGVSQVRSLLKSLSGFSSVTIVERETNFGLAKSIITGVSDIVSRYGRIIVMEDDLVTSPHFLRYMNDALDLYQDQERVASAHAYIYPVRGTLPETFFLRGSDCWGWATWKRSWDLFEPDGAKLLAELRSRKLTRAFDRDGSYGYTKMLEDQIAGRNDSWAVRWYASAFLADRLTLYPGRSLVQNIGMDALGTHCDDTHLFDVNLTGNPVRVESIPLREDPPSARKVSEYLRSLRPGLARRIFGTLKSRIGLKG